MLRDFNETGKSPHGNPDVSVVKLKFVRREIRRLESVGGVMEFLFNVEGSVVGDGEGGVLRNFKKLWVSIRVDEDPLPSVEIAAILCCL